VTTIKTTGHGYIRKRGFGPGETQVALGNLYSPKELLMPWAASDVFGRVAILHTSLGVFHNVTFLHISLEIFESPLGGLWISSGELWISPGKIL
jgi:hypothetical protein